MVSELVRTPRDKYETRSQCAGEESPHCEQVLLNAPREYKSKGYKSGGSGGPRSGASSTCPSVMKGTVEDITHMTAEMCRSTIICYLTTSGTSTGRPASKPFYRKSQYPLQ
jgi:hypothetical protein